jgi:hypothetical protein
MFSGCSGYKSHHLVDGIKQLFNGTCDFSTNKKKSLTKDSEGRKKKKKLFQLTWLSPKTFGDPWFHRVCDLECVSVLLISCLALGMHLQFY